MFAAVYITSTLHFIAGETVDVNFGCFCVLVFVNHYC